MNQDEAIYLVTKTHKSNYPNPIRLSRGQCVLVGEMYQGDEGWDNWIYCRTIGENLSGWVPAQIIANKGKLGLILENYTAKELDVNDGDKLLKIKELNGWYWVKNLGTFEEGWVPKNNVKIMKSTQSK